MTSGEIQTGKRIMSSPLTGQLYLVTRWEDLGDGKFKSLEKEKLRDPPLGYTLPGIEGMTFRPRGPLGDEPADAPVTAAIGFCPRCGENARLTTEVRGTFNCPGCSYQWHDSRVGEQTRKIEDYFTSADSSPDSE